MVFIEAIHLDAIWNSRRVCAFGWLRFFRISLDRIRWSLSPSLMSLRILSDHNSPSTSELHRRYSIFDYSVFWNCPVRIGHKCGTRWLHRSQNHVSMYYMQSCMPLLSILFQIALLTVENDRYVLITNIGIWLNKSLRSTRKKLSLKYFNGHFENTIDFILVQFTFSQWISIIIHWFNVGYGLNYEKFDIPFTLARNVKEINL